MAEALVGARVEFRLGRLNNLEQELKRPRGPVKRALDTWERLYGAFIVARFDRFSRGTGNWRKLKPATIRRKRSSAILVDRRILRLGLAAKGGVRALGRDGLTLRFGFGNKSRHPARRGRSKLTIADIATIHHAGLGRVPARKILVAPGPAVRRQMIETMITACKETMK